MTHELSRNVIKNYIVNRPENVSGILKKLCKLVHLNVVLKIVLVEKRVC